MNVRQADCCESCQYCVFDYDFGDEDFICIFTSGKKHTDFIDPWDAREVLGYITQQERTNKNWCHAHPTEICDNFLRREEKA